MKDIKIIGTTVILPSILEEESRNFYVENLGFQLLPNGNVKNDNLSINFVQIGADNFSNSRSAKVEDCKVVLQYEDLSLIDLSKMDVINGYEVPYGRFIYVKDIAGNIICLSELYA